MTVDAEFGLDLGLFDDQAVVASAVVVFDANHASFDRF